MRLLMVAPYLGSTYGGTSKMVQSLASELAHQGLSIDLISTNANDGAVLEVPLQTWVPTNGYRVQYFNCWHRHDLIVSPPLRQWLRNHLQDYDIVHTHTVFSPLMTGVNQHCRQAQMPYVITPHGMLEPWALSHKSWKKQLYFKVFEAPNLVQASAIQGLAQPEVANLHALGFAQTTLIPNGVHAHEVAALGDPQPFYQQFPQASAHPLILFLGRLDPKKGLDLLAEAFAQVHHRYPQSHLVVAGPDSIGFRDTAETYFREAGCFDAVTFTGMLTGALKSAALSAADLYVAPSYSEGFSMSVLEGMMAGLACVITTGCNFPEAQMVGAAKVVDIHADAISQALLDCIADPEQRQALGNQAQQFIFEHYTWEKIGANLIQVYETILDHHSTP